MNWSAWTWTFSGWIPVSWTSASANTIRIDRAFDAAVAESVAMYGGMLRRLKDK